MGYTAEQKAEAVALYVAEGLAEAHRRTGYSKTSLQRWATEAGHDLAELAGRTNEKTRAATETRIALMGRHKTELAADLLEDLQRLRRQLFAPCVEKKVVTLSGGKDHPATWEIVDVKRDQPTFGEQVQILTSIGIATDKVQVLTGEATSIVRTPWDPKAVTEEAAPRAEGLRSVPTGEAV